MKSWNDKIEEYQKQGYSFNWKDTEETRIKKSWFSSTRKLQVKQVRLTMPPGGAFPHPVTRWKTIELIRGE
jgi:hypothetical protein